MNSEATSRANDPRAHCYRCDKPLLRCLCARIVRVENRTPIVILQHKRESRHPLGTVRIADLGLAQCRVEVVPGGAKSSHNPPGWLPSGAGLLYPARGARDLAALPPEQRPRALVAVDGTWHQARALFRDHLWLQDLPRYALSPSEPSRYRIRREPRPNYRSTLEAIVQALTILEPELEARRLLDAFDGLIDDQVNLASKQGRAPRKRELRPLGVRLMPQLLVESFERLVLVYGEAARPEHDPAAPTELVHWAALRLRDGATFDYVLRPQSGVPSALRLRHLALERTDIEQGGDAPGLCANWQEFLQAEDQLAAWNPRTLALFSECMQLEASGVGLKGVYRRIRGGSGDLESVLALEAAASPPPALSAALRAVRGRARLRLENALRIVFFLRTLALESRDD